jgi:hypothetical protein
MLEIGILKTWNGTTYKAGVQLAGSLTTYLDNISVSVSIPSSAMVVGNFVLAAIPGGNLKDACVIATWPAGTPPEEEGVAAALVEAHRLSATHSQPQPPVTHANDKHTIAYAAQSDFLAHASRHIWPGADAGNFLRTLIARQDSVLIVDWQTRDLWTDYFTGSGSRTLNALLEQKLSTGTTINSISAMYTQPFATLSPHSASRITAFLPRPRSDPANSEWWFIATKETQPVFPITTHRHIGFRILNGSIWATNGNGTNGTQTDTGVSLAIHEWARLAMLAVSGTVKFYVQKSGESDLTLRATHSTNLPTEWDFAFWIGGTNTSAADKPYSIHSLGMST